MRSPQPEIILPSDPRAAVLVENVQIWKSVKGNLFISEEAARDDSATHVPCVVCGEPAMKPLQRCPVHQEEYEAQEYLKREAMEWDGNSPVYSDSKDQYYSSMDHCLDDLEDGETLRGLRLLICKRSQLSELRDDQWYNEISEEDEFPDELAQAIEEFNEKIRAIKIRWYFPTKYRVDTSAWEGQ